MRGEDGLIVFSSVSKTFGPSSDPRPALAEISFSVKQSEFISLIGPSGCGKSTLLRLLAGFQTPTSGSIYYDGAPVRGPSARRPMIFQEYGLFPWMSVADNITFALQCKRINRRERLERLDELLGMTNLRGCEDQYPRQLSGGMQQRVGIARALAADPDLVLCDEPLGALDLLTREEMQEEILRLKLTTGKTFLFVTHSVEEAVFLSDRVLVVTGNPGRLRADVTIELTHERDANTRTKDPRFHRYRENLSRMLRERED